METEIGVEDTTSIEEGKKKWSRRRKKWEEVIEETKEVTSIAGPMVLVSVLQYLIPVVSTMMVGHLGHVTLASVAIATSLTNVTGFSLLSGLVGGLETLCGQAYGAKQYHKLSIYTYSAAFSLLAVCVPVSVLWLFMAKLLVLMRQDPLVSLEAQSYSLRLIPALFGAALSKPLVRYLQTQSLIFPMVLSSLMVLCCHVPITWALVYKLDMGSSGAAMAVCVSNWVYVAVLAVYVKCSPSCKNTRLDFSVEAFSAMGEFFRFAVPSAVMVCLKWWSLEVLVLVSGLLPNPTLETSLLSICLTISTLHFTIPYGIGGAASTRVSNELGGGNPEKARLIVWVAMFLAVVETTAVSMLLLCLRHIIGRAYTSEPPLLNYISRMVPLICLSTITDSLQAIISGIARGSGWQHVGAYVNLVAFYGVGIPAAVVLGFVDGLKARGLWIGILIASLLQSLILSIVTAFTNWNKQAMRAKERLAQHQDNVEDEQI